MNERSQPPAGHRLAGPPEMAGFLRDRPRTFISPNGRDGLVLQRFCNLPAVIDVPPMRDEVLVCHLGEPFLAEIGIGTRHYERRWIGPGQLGVNPAGSSVRREIKGRPDVVLLHLPPSRLRAVAEEAFEIDPARVELVPTVAEADETAERLIRLLLREAMSPEVGLPLMCASLASALMVHVLRRHSNLAPQRSEPQNGLSPGRVRRVIEYMHAHLDHASSLADLAQIGGISTSRFVRAFHVATGQPPHRFLVRLRIEEACRLLEQSDLPVIDIGLRCGFSQPSHFANMFRNAMGMSPGTWRRERRG